MSLLCIRHFSLSILAHPIITQLNLQVQLGELWCVLGRNGAGKTTLLKKINQNPEHILWYFLNPLVIIEGIGNLHGEAFMICFTLASILCIFHKKVVLGGLFMALAIAAKLLPLLIVPLFFRFLDLRKFIFFILYIFIFSLILMI